MQQYLAHYLNNERGISLIPVIIILFIGTIIGIAASTTSQFEIKIAANDRTYKQNFFRADAINQLADRLLEDMSAERLQDQTPTTDLWLTKSNDPIDPLDDTNWANAGSGKDYFPAETSETSFEEIRKTRFVALDRGPAEGTEISMGSKLMHKLSVFGRYDDPVRGRVIIETEYRKKY